MAIKSGILNNEVRDEIVNSVSTLMMVHTLKPTSEEYNTVCSRLIMAYPTLKDNCDNGYVRVHSFFDCYLHVLLEIVLVMKFKNIQ